MTVQKINTISVSIDPDIERRARTMAKRLDMSLSAYVAESIFFHNEHVSGEPQLLPIFKNVGITGSWDDGSPEAEKIRSEISTGKTRYKEVKG